MPTEYPGLYWDESKKRYFPISSRPKPSPSTTAPSIISNNNILDEKLTPKTRPPPSHLGRHHVHVPWHAHLNRLSNSCYAQTLRNSHDILCFHYSKTSACNTESVPSMGPIQVFCVTQMDGKTCQIAGDDRGWIYTRTALGSEHVDSHRWIPRPISTTSDPISSIIASNYHRVVTCLGPGKVSVQSMLIPESIWFLNFTSIYDIRASNLRGRTLVLGASKKAAYLADIDQTRNPEYLTTNSDVFSIARDNTLVYLGTRSGSVHRFDMRMPKNKSQKLFDNRFGGNPRSSVLHLDVNREYEFFMSHSNGDLVVYDLRFAPDTPKAVSPIRVFQGHINTHSQNLGIAIDHERDILFAAGQDRRIRAWSLRTGGAPLTPFPPSPSLTLKTHPVDHDHAHVQDDREMKNPLSDTFPDPIPALQVTEETGVGVCLWASSGKRVYQYRLGQQMGFGE